MAFTTVRLLGGALIAALIAAGSTGAATAQLPGVSEDTGATVSWTRQFGTSAEDDAESLTLDDERVLVAGTTSGTLPGEAGFGGKDAFLRGYRPSGSLTWTRQFGTPRPDEARAVAADGRGNAYVAGRTEGTFPGQARQGDWDAWVRKYGPGGAVAWTRQFGTAGYAEATALAVDGQGFVYLAGETVGTLAGPARDGGQDPFIRRYTRTGTISWTRQFGSAGAGYDEAHALAVDERGNVYIVGLTEGTLPGQSSHGSADAFVRKYGPDGAVRWTRQFGTARDDTALAIALDDLGNAYIAGSTKGRFAGQASHGGSDAFVRKYGPGGAILWTGQFGTPEDDEASSVAVDAAGGVRVAGSTGGALPGQVSHGQADAFVRRLGRGGAVTWTRQFGTPETDGAAAIAVSGLGDTFVAGSTQGALPGHANRGSSDAYVRRYGTEGR